MPSQRYLFKGFIIKNKKYSKVNICPIKINGSSTGRPPIHVKINHDEINTQKINFLIG